MLNFIRNTYRYIIYEIMIVMMLSSFFTGCRGIKFYKIKEKNMTEYYDIEFHRGGRDARPENTLYAYQYALENGASTIECDMQLINDGELVLSHNLVLNPDITVDLDGNRIKENTYYISDMTLMDIKKFNVGNMDKSSEYYKMHGQSQVETDAFIPSLRELFQLVKDSGDENIKISIEAKTYPDPAMGVIYEKSPDKDKLLEKFISLVKEFGYEDRVILQSFDWDVLVRMKKINPLIETIALYNEQPSWGTIDATTLWLDKKEASPWLAGINIHDYDDDPVKAAHSIGIDHLSPYYEEVSDILVEEAHSYGMKVIPWTVNYVEDMKKLYDMGVDGIITDRPWVLRTFLESNGEKVRDNIKINLPYHLDPNHKNIVEEKVKNGMDSME